MKPLEGITILEFSTMITASFAAMMMAEQGASVIKVEPMNVGDPMSAPTKAAFHHSLQTVTAVSGRFGSTSKKPKGSSSFAS